MPICERRDLSKLISPTKLIFPLLFSPSRYYLSPYSRVSTVCDRFKADRLGNGGKGWYTSLLSQSDMGLPMKWLDVASFVCQHLYTNGSVHLWRCRELRRSRLQLQ
jgi:hypothetical protein